MSSNGSVVSEGNTRFVPKTYAITNDQPVVALDARTAFEKLTEREQLYAHYISRYILFLQLVQPIGTQWARKFKKVQAKKLVKSNKSISRKNCFNIFHEN